MKKIVFVGGGIVSCVSALELLKRGYHIEIYEKHNRLGGILRDYSTNDHFFFRGCKYLNIKNSWFNIFYKNFSKNLQVFDHNYGVYVENNKDIFFSDKYAVPIFKNINLKEFTQNFKKLNVYKIQTISDRFNFYPKKIKIFLKNIILRHKLNPDKLNQISTNGFQLSRIASVNNCEKIYKLKKKFSLIDNLLALNRSILFKRKLKAALPKNGYDELFNDIKSKLLNAGAQVKLNSKLTLDWKKKRLNLFNDGVEIKNDLIIWTGDPTAVVKSFNGEDLESNNYKVIQFNSNIKVSKNFRTTYVQVFSEQSNIIRISLYKIKNIKKISIETIFDSQMDIQEIYNEALKILERFNIFLVLDNASFSKNLDLRFNIISQKDFEILKKFNYEIRGCNLLSKFWLQYGIDKKIHSLFAELKKKICNFKS